MKILIGIVIGGLLPLVCKLVDERVRLWVSRRRARRYLRRHVILSDR